MKFYNSRFIFCAAVIGALLIFAIPDTFTRGEKMMHLSTSNHVMVVPLPEEISLAGESMPESIDSRESLSREMQVNSFWHSNTIQMLQRSGRFFPVIESILSEEEIEKTISELESISDGGAALTAYGKIQYTDMSESEKEDIAKGLFHYCELDTLAMVMIYEHLKSLV